MGMREKFIREDFILYLDMIGRSLSPQIRKKIGDIKPYYKLLKDRNSRDFKRFIAVYLEFRSCLSEKEQFVLDQLYGLHLEGKTLKNIGVLLNLSPSRISQYRNKAELKIAIKIKRLLKIYTNELTQV